MPARHSSRGVARSGRSSVRGDEQTFPRRSMINATVQVNQPEFSYLVIIWSPHQWFACHVVQSWDLGRIIGRAVNTTRREVNPAIRDPLKQQVIRYVDVHDQIKRYVVFPTSRVSNCNWISVNAARLTRGNCLTAFPVAACVESHLESSSMDPRVSHT